MPLTIGSLGREMAVPLEHLKTHLARAAGTNPGGTDPASASRRFLAGRLRSRALQGDRASSRCVGERTCRNRTGNQARVANARDRRLTVMTPEELSEVEGHLCERILRNLPPAHRACRSQPLRDD